MARERQAIPVAAVPSLAWVGLVGLAAVAYGYDANCLGSPCRTRPETVDMRCRMLQRVSA